MFTFFKVLVYKLDWLVVFEQEGTITKMHNDRGALERFLSSVQILVGYNNFNYDDRIIASILKKVSPYATSQKLLEGKRFNLKLTNPLTLDAMQEIKSNISLKEVQANMKINIFETPIDSDIDFDLTEKQTDLVFQNCENDVLFIKDLFEKRDSYFSSKFEIVNEFNLPVTSLKTTRANLASEVLKSKPTNDTDRLKIVYDQRLPLKELPGDIVNFYKQISDSDEKFEELEKKNLTYKLHGIDHVFGFGGLHGARENYRGEGNYMQVDIKSYYPTIMINNGFINNVDEYKKLYETRNMLGSKGDTKEEVYKVLLSGTYGAMKSKYNNLYNPRQANNIVVNGQLFLAYLIESIRPTCELIQSNTDGIIIKYENVMKESIIWLLEMFEKKFNFSFKVDLITKVAQKDVNNYVVQYTNGKIKAKGRFMNYEGGNYERNSLSIIDKALVDYYMFGKNINKTVVECWKTNKLDYFQNVVKAGAFDGMVHEVKQSTLLEGSFSSQFKGLQNVNRVFATKDKQLGTVYKVKKGRETKYSKVPYTSDHCIVWNDDLSKFDKRKIDLNWYIKEAEKYLISQQESR